MSNSPVFKSISRRSVLRLAAIGAAIPILNACQPQVVEKIVEKPVEKIVEKVVTQIVEKEKIVEKVVTAPAVLKREPILMKYGHGVGPTDPLHLTWVELAQNINLRTEGALKIEVFPSSQIGTDVQIFEQVSLGAPMIAGFTDGWAGTTVPDFNIFTAPFIWKDWSEAKKVYFSDLMKDLEKQLEQKGGWTIIGRNWPFGARHIINSKRELKVPDDTKGLKIRTPQIPMWVETFKAMGATPVPLALAEIYPGLQQGLIDGAEGPFSQIVSLKKYEVAKFYSLTGHFWQVNGAVGGKFFRDLPKDLRAVIVEEYHKSGEVYRLSQEKSELEGAKILQDNGVKITEVDKEPWRKATAVVYEIVGKTWTPGMFDKVIALRDKK